MYILERCAGKPNVGETVLSKLLYFSDFNYYELYEEHLTGAKYLKLPYGPIPQKLDAMIMQMMDNKLQHITKHTGTGIWCNSKNNAQKLIVHRAPDVKQKEPKLSFG